MVARSVGSYTDALREAARLEVRVEVKMEKFAEIVGEALSAQVEEVRVAIRQLQEEVERNRKHGGKGGEDNKKDRKRTEPKDPFNGVNHIEWEWRLNNHMETCFGCEGRRLMKWIRERAKTDDRITATEGEMEFDDWYELDKELWTQVMRSEGEEVTNIIQSATADGVVGAEAWRALKSRYDPETAITLEAWRGELFKVKRCTKMSDLVSRITQWENKMNRLNNALRASGKADISDEDRSMVLKDLIPGEMEEELRK